MEAAHPEVAFTYVCNSSALQSCKMQAKKVYIYVVVILFVSVRISMTH